MKKQYFAWKDGTNELAEITAKEFLAICKSSKVVDKANRRYFARIPGLTEDDTYYLIECTYENYKKSVAESQARYRRSCEKRDLKAKGLWYDILSLNYSYTNNSCEELTLYDIIADESSLFEEKLINDIAIESAYNHLTDEEKLIIDNLYLKNYENKSEREFAEQIGIPQKTINNRKLKILKKLKKCLAQNRSFRNY